MKRILLMSSIINIFKRLPFQAVFFYNVTKVTAYNLIIA